MSPSKRCGCLVRQAWDMAGFERDSLEQEHRVNHKWSATARRERVGGLGMLCLLRFWKALRAAGMNCHMEDLFYEDESEIAVKLKNLAKPLRDEKTRAHERPVQGVAVSDLLHQEL